MNLHNLATGETQWNFWESYLQYGAADDDAVESVEGGVEVRCQAKSVHPHTWWLISQHM